MTQFRQVLVVVGVLVGMDCSGMAYSLEVRACADRRQQQRAGAD